MSVVNKIIADGSQSTKATPLLTGESFTQFENAISTVWKDASGFDNKNSLQLDNDTADEGDSHFIQTAGVYLQALPRELLALKSGAHSNSSQGWGGFWKAISFGKLG